MNTKIKRTLITLSALTLTSMSLFAQGIIIRKTDGTTQKVPYEQLQSIDTYDLEETPEDVESDERAVDLGLSVKWATMNVGANSPEEYGNYYAWGETEPKAEYNWNTYKWCNGSYTTLTKYCFESYYGKLDNNMVLELTDDVAHVKWGGDWRMPTQPEVDELINECTWTWTLQNGVNGYIVTGPNGRSIFLPAAGSNRSHGPGDVGAYGAYWSSSLDSDVTYDAYGLIYASYYKIHDANERRWGNSVRPVYPNLSFIRVNSITLDRDSWVITAGESFQLSATVSPANATNKNVIWSSSNKSVATVSVNGLVTTMKAGTVTITATATDGSGVTANCTVTVESGSYGQNNGHDYVDLGLSVKWATMNVGANSPEDYGNYYAWGETEPKATYSWNTYFDSVNGSDSNFNEYATNKKIVLDPKDDVAHVKWGGDWHMPTKAELSELVNECTWTWTTQGGKNGYKITSNKNGNSIFLPATAQEPNTLGLSLTQGCYWSSSLFPDPDYSNNAFFLSFKSSTSYLSATVRYKGHCVRAVCP